MQWRGGSQITITKLRFLLSVSFLSEATQLWHDIERVGKKSGGSKGRGCECCNHLFGCIFLTEIVVSGQSWCPQPSFFWGGGDGKCPILSCILFEIFRIRPTGTTCHAHCICIVIGTERFRYTSYDVPLNYQVSTLAVNWKEKIQTCPPPSPWIFVFRPASVRG